MIESNTYKEFERVPENWNVTELGKIFSWSSGKARPKDVVKTKTNESSFPVYGGNGILGYSSQKLFDEPKLILGRVGEYCGCSHLTKGQSWISDNALYAKTILTDVSLIYFKYYFDYLDLNRYANKNGQPLITQGNINQIKIVVPPLVEQNYISDILSLIQSAIEKQEHIIKSAVELKNALMKRLFAEGINNEPRKETEIGLIPESWKVVELEKAGEVIYGIQAAVANNTKPIGTKILTNVNINLDGNINLTKTRYYQLKSKRDFSTILKKGDILFNWRSGSKEHVGKTALFNLDGEYTHSSFILRIRPNEKIDNEYLFYYLFNLRQSGYFMNMQDYSVNAKFNKSAINKLAVALPGLEEQKFIAKAISSANMKLELHTKKYNNLQSLFQTMLHQLMTGAIRLENDSKKQNTFSSEQTQNIKLSA